MIAPGDWPHVRALFHEALQRPAAERAAFVRSAAASPEIMSEVESLLAAEQAADGFLSTPPVAIGDRASTPLLTGHTRLGHFEILELVGAGGMGEVYRARDTRLDRTVAIKVLSRDLLLHAEARDRFEHEARLISKFSHPHVCTLHDVGTAAVAGTEIQFLVMELVAGESLAARLQRGPLPIAEAMKAGIEILDALAAAHAAGVVHRDLKPGNVMLTRSGVKLLDFGVARLVQTTVPTERQSGIHNPLSKDGMVLGTMPYMSPEQLRGEAADARSDLFAFGAVLYEMVTGVRAFTADTDTALVAAILEREPPPIASLRPDAPAGLDRIVATCLAKSPEDRWPRARDVLRELTWLRDDTGHRVTSVPAPRASRRYWIALVAAAAAVIAVAALIAGVMARGDPAPAARVSFTIAAPKTHTFPRATAEMAMSPDGSRLAFVAFAANGTRHLWVRQFDDPQAQALDGTDGATMPFWSPDGHAIGFFTSGQLKRINVDGTALATICEAPFSRGGAWNRDGVILFGAQTTLRRVPAGGGTPIEVTALDLTRHDRVHAWPVFLPDGRRFLFLNLNTDPSKSAIYQASLDSPRMERVVAAATSFEIVGSRLMWVSRRALIAQDFDRERAAVVGEPREIVRGVGVDTRIALAGFAAAQSGVLAYRAVGDQSRLTWHDRSGRQLGVFNESGDYQHPALSPDERWIAIEKTDASTSRHTIWILDVARGVLSRLLVDPYGAHAPVWSADGRTVLFISNRVGGGNDVFTIGADGGPQTLAIPVDGALHRPTDWSQKPPLFLYEHELVGNSDIWVAPQTPMQVGTPFIATGAYEGQARFSPDVRWVAYTSDESGTPEVYVRPYPGSGGAWRVSTNGGAQPQWRGDGKELFYLAADGNLMAADVGLHGVRFETGTPHPLFDTGIRGLFVERRNHYVVTRDGQRFLINVTEEDDNVAPLTVVMNWER